MINYTPMMFTTQIQYETERIAAQAQNKYIAADYRLDLDYLLYAQMFPNVAIKYTMITSPITWLMFIYLLVYIFIDSHSDSKFPCLVGGHYMNSEL